MAAARSKKRSCQVSLGCPEPWRSRIGLPQRPLMMPQDRTFAFGPFQLFPAQRALFGDDKAVRLGGRALDILIELVKHSGEIIGKEALMARVWPDVVVDEGSLRVHISALRRALGDD